MTTIQVARVAPFFAPARTPHSGILSLATVRDGIGYLSQDGLVESFNCIGVDVDALDDCADFTTLTKRFDPPSFSDGALFNIQAGMRCKPFGFDMNDSRIRAAFNAMEA